ncbi:MAG: hypothetical protein QM820_05360 [Minicystis sp.]
MKRASRILGSIALLHAAACTSSGGGTTGSGGAATTAMTSTVAGTGGGGAGGSPVITTCDPFTGKPCDLTGGQTCDWDGASFSCFDGPNQAKLCEPCGPGGYCVLGLTCLDAGKCTPFCCDDGDCGAGAVCDRMYIGDPHVGVCFATASGMGGSDAGAASNSPACNAPAMPPSMGACTMP